MIVTEKYLTEAYARLNTQLFAGLLPQVPLRIVAAKSFLGNVRSSITRTADGRIRYHDFVLQISRNFDLTPLQLDSVIAHEMIHLFIQLHSLPDSGTHGEIFLAMMHAFNREHGLQIDVKSTGAPIAQSAPKPMLVVARMKLTNGQTAIKVLPRVADTIRKYCNAVRRSGQVKTIELYLSDNPLFSRYPKSGALKLYYIDPAILDAALSGSAPLNLS